MLLSKLGCLNPHIEFSLRQCIYVHPTWKAFSSWKLLAAEDELGDIPDPSHLTYIKKRGKCVWSEPQLIQRQPPSPSLKGLPTLPPHLQPSHPLYPSLPIAITVTVTLTQCCILLTVALTEKKPQLWIPTHRSHLHQTTLRPLSLHTHAPPPLKYIHTHRCAHKPIVYSLFQSLGPQPPRVQYHITPWATLMEREYMHALCCHIKVCGTFPVSLLFIVKL